jgi:hypothetical protein
MSSFSWEYTYSFYQSYFLFHLQHFLDFSEAVRIHICVQPVDWLPQEITVLDVVEDFKGEDVVVEGQVF